MIDLLREWSGYGWFRWSLAGAAIIVAVPVAWVVATIVVRSIRRLMGLDPAASRGPTHRKIKRSLVVWLFLLACYGALRIPPLTPGAQDAVGKAVIVLFTLSLTFFLANLATGGIRHYAARRQLAVPVTSLTETVVRLVVVIVGFMLVLNNLGVQITPLLTALGIGSLAVALALQDTLTGLFAGFYLVATKDFNPGDYVQIVGGREGYVVDIGWRHTRIHELPGNIVLIPNSELVKATIVNTSLPQKDLAVLVPVGVAYGSDLEKIERVTVETAREVMKTVKGGVADFEPFIRYHTFGSSSIDFTVILRAAELVDQFLVKHEFVKRLHARYRAEGIEIPFPQRVVHLQKEA
ncbi:MAG: mechanosensitive ion channel family protein [Planctomycetes bacterium]|nr:mechanosensitive ion channel family protein [Planctomycetota bacterium]